MRKFLFPKKQKVCPTDDELLSKTMDWLRFPLALAVVFIHLNVKVDIRKVDYSSLSGMDIYTIAVTLMSYLTGIAVPCFFVFSGFLFFFKVRDWSRSTYANKIKSRFKTLLVPYLLWNVITICLYALLKLRKADGSPALYLNEIYEKGLWRIFWNYSEWGADSTNIFGQLIPSYGPYLLPLWFLRDLIILSVLSTLIYRAVRFGGIYTVFFAGILYYTKVDLGIPEYSMSQFSTALFFFTFGAWFSINGKNLIVALRSGRLYRCLTAIVCMLAAIYFSGNKARAYIYPLFLFFGVITTINVTAFFIERGTLKVVSTLSKASFFVYATHGILILSFTTRLFDKVFPSEHVAVLPIRYFCVPTICALVCLGVYCLMRRTMPKLLNLLTGNRS